jgi:histidine ammonia-lyase
MEQGSVTVGVGPVSPANVVAVARYDATVVIADDAWAEVRKSREIIEALADDQ